jgi:exonuclease III
LTWQDKDFLLGTVHLLPKNHASSDTQSLEAKDYVREVRLVEKDEQQKNTILIGDFNMNPFDPGMISASTFNSVCSPAIALKRCRTFQWESYDYFFNPTWKNYAGVGKDIYGTYYHHSCGADEFHWNNFDQALVSPSILQQYNPEFSILHDVLRFDLRKENNGISDHYPILLELKEK